MRYKCLEFMFLSISIMKGYSQCFSEPILGTKIGNIHVETDDYELSNFMASILQFAHHCKKGNI